MNNFLESLAYGIQDLLKKWAHQIAGVIFALASTYFLFAIIGHIANSLNLTPIFITEESYNWISSLISRKAILASGLIAGLAFFLQREISRNY